MTDPADLGVEAAIDALSEGAVTAWELTANCLGRINGPPGRALNAFIHIADDAARAQAAASDERRKAGKLCSRLDGVPIAIKDNIDVFGMPTTNGLATKWHPDADAPVIQRLRDAGMVFLGKLNMHEAALGATTDNPHHGRCHNALRHGYTPGGSSGGSAAAVAGRLCPVTLGTDTMGSVRLPAAYCGIVGFKPSRTYWPVDGVMPLAFELDTIGPLARSVSGIAAVLQEDIANLDPSVVRFAKLANAREIKVEPECVAAFDAALAQMECAIGPFVDVELSGYDPGDARRSGFIVSEVDAFAAHKRLLAEVPSAFSPEFRAMLEYGRKISPERYASERAAIKAVGDAVMEVFDDVDVLVTLTAPQRAFPFDVSPPVNQADLTAPANFAGCPAISLPLGQAPEELPIGLQLISAPGTDRRLLAIAQSVEALLKRCV